MSASISVPRVLLTGCVLQGWLISQDCRASLVGPGDIAFIRFNADGFDDLAIVLLADADAGQRVTFNDNFYISELNKFSAAENSFIWEINQALSAGTVVTFTNLDRSTGPGVASHGVVNGLPMRTMRLSDTAETVYAYLGTDPLFPGTFLGAISTESSSVLTGTGLTVGQTAVILTASADEAHYKGVRNTEAAFADYRPFIGNVGANWHVRGNTGTLPAFDTTNFQIPSGPATPESPRVILVGLMGLLLCLRLMARRTSPHRTLYAMIPPGVIAGERSSGPCAG